MVQRIVQVLHGRFELLRLHGGQGIILEAGGTGQVLKGIGYIHDALLALGHGIVDALFQVFDGFPFFARQAVFGFFDLLEIVEEILEAFFGQEHFIFFKLLGIGLDYRVHHLFAGSGGSGLAGGNKKDGDNIKGHRQ